MIYEDLNMENLALRQEVETLRLQLGLAYKRLDIAEGHLNLISDLPCIGYKRGPQLAIDALEEMEKAQ